MKPFYIYLLATLGIILAIGTALYLLSIQPESTSATLEKALYIIDGDTFNTQSGETIRLLCVDTPERSQTGYEDASAYLSMLILGKDVKVEREYGKDKYNRTLAWVYVDNILVNKMIIDEGFGVLYEYEGTNCERVK